MSIQLEWTYFYVSYFNIGQHFSNGDQYYDGVPYVTQCPINPGAK